MASDRLGSLRWSARSGGTSPVTAQHVAIVVPLVGIAISEGLLFVGNTGDALWGHLATLLFCTLGMLRLRGQLPLLRAFALVPLFRLVNLGMPVFFQLTVFWFPLIYGPLIPGLYLLVRSQSPVEPELVRRPSQLVGLLPAAFLASIVLAELEFAILQPEGLIPAWTAQNVLLLAVVMVGFVGLVEELLFRGILQRTLQSELGRWPGLLLASGVFGLMHSGYGIPAEVGFAAGIGLALGLVYDWTDSLALVSIIHGTLNVFLFGVIPLRGSMLPF